MKGLSFCLNEKGKKRQRFHKLAQQRLMNKSMPGGLLSVTRWQQKIMIVQQTVWKFDALIRFLNIVEAMRSVDLSSVNSLRRVENLQWQLPVSSLSAVIPGLLIAKNFCGSILADCFVLTPHNNQLRHCQRNTHSSRVQPPVSGLALPSRVPTGLWCMCPPASLALPTLSIPSFVVMVLLVVVGRQWSHTESPPPSPRGWRGALPTAGSSVSRAAAEVHHPA